MFTVIGWNEDVVAVNTYEPIAGAKDQHVKVVDDVVYCPPLNKLVFAAARGRIYRGRLESPSLRRLAYNHINPSENTGLAADYKFSPLIMYQGESPLPLIEGEGLEAKAYANDIEATYTTIIAGFADGPLAPVRGEIWTIRATASITAVKSSWENGELTFEPTLPVGKYQIVGALMSSTDVLAFRFVPIGSMYRPGGVACTEYQMGGPPMFRKGGIGVWCEFDSLTPPSVDILAETIGVKTCVIFLDIIKIA